MTIYDIKRLTAETSPHFFDESSLRFFGQTLEMFTVEKQPDGRYKIEAGTMGFMPGIFGKKEGFTEGLRTVRYFNPLNNELERN
jgi:hypothetical protein